MPTTNNFGFACFTTVAAMICMTIEPIIAFGLTPLIGALWFFWTSERIAVEHLTRQKELEVEALGFKAYIVQRATKINHKGEKTPETDAPTITETTDAPTTPEKT